MVEWIRYGMLAGLSYLVAMAILNSRARPAPDRGQTAAEGDVTSQVWQVLAEARRITQEAAHGL